MSIVSVIILYLQDDKDPILLRKLNKVSKVLYSLSNTITRILMCTHLPIFFKDKKHKRLYKFDLNIMKVVFWFSNFRYLQCLIFFLASPLGLKKFSHLKITQKTPCTFWNWCPDFITSTECIKNKMKMIWYEKMF